MKTIKIGIVGATGKLGRSIIALAHDDPSLVLAGGVGRIADMNHWHGLFASSEIIIDVSSSDNLERVLEHACREQKPLVIGTTGHDSRNFQLMRQASSTIPLFYTPNFSLGIAAVSRAVFLLSRALGSITEIAIDETHHIHKKDSPSGTALHLARTVTEASGKEPPITSERKDEVIGDHTVTFSCNEERISIGHKALSRTVFAKGALLAVKFLARQPPGLYSMAELLDEGSYASCKN